LHEASQIEFIPIRQENPLIDGGFLRLNPGMEICFIYVPIADLDAGRTLARQLIDEKLVACANFIPGLSIYPWKGKIEETAETYMILKTSRSLFPLASDRIRELHNYETPCILEIPIGRINEAYLKWLEGNLVT
jgi:periplasmic divalent cation tolerance protein